MFRQLAKLSLLTLFAMGLVACSGNRPDHLGGVNDYLMPCPDSPNCVSSQADPADSTHYIEAISIDNDQSAMKALAALIRQQQGATVIVESDTYIYAEYSSDLMGFVDDVEFLQSQQAGKIHVRSASRLGYRDFDVNRERIEAIRKALLP